MRRMKKSIFERKWRTVKEEKFKKKLKQENMQKGRKYSKFTYIYAMFIMRCKFFSLYQMWKNSWM